MPRLPMRGCEAFPLACVQDQAIHAIARSLGASAGGRLVGAIKCHENEESCQIKSTAHLGHQQSCPPRYSADGLLMFTEGH